MFKRRYFPIYLIAIGLTLISILALASPTRALEFKSGDEVVISQGDVVEDDLYVGADTLIVEGTIAGDLVAFGRIVHIKPSGVIEGDLIAAAQSIEVEGVVEDDVRAAGAVIVLSRESTIGDDLVTAGYSLETLSGSQVGGDVLFTGYQAKLGGDVEGDVTVFGNGLELQGNVAGSVVAELGSAQDTPPFMPFGFIPDMPAVPSVPGGLTVGSQAQIGGDLEYTSEGVFAIPAGAVAGDETRIEPSLPPETEREEQVAPSSTTVWFRRNLSNLLTLLVLGLLMAWLTPGFLGKSTQALRSKPWQSLGLGLLSFAVIFFGVLILGAITVLLTLVLGLITLGELVWVALLAGLLAIAIFAFVFVVSAMYLSKLVVSFVAGRFILEKIKPDWAESRYWSMILGVILFAILAAIPYLGWLITIIVILFGLGALFLLEIDWFRGMSARRIESE
jgi:cytoskeletal protein CcmA (bactofilin family)